jgi:hypothetical protein
MSNLNTPPRCESCGSAIALDELEFAGAEWAARQTFLDWDCHPDFVKSFATLHLLRFTRRLPLSVCAQRVASRLLTPIRPMQVTNCLTWGIRSNGKKSRKREARRQSESKHNF